MKGSLNPLEGNLESGPRNSAVGQTMMFLSGCSGMRGCRVETKWSLKVLLHRCKRAMKSLADGKDSEITMKDIAIIVTLAVLLLISIGFNIYLAAKRQHLETDLSSLCPHGWVRSQSRCYHFSATQEAWDVGQDHCFSYRGSLVVMDTPQERDFVMSSQGVAGYWIGLWREGVGQPWKQPNGSLFSNWFPIGGEGCCAYLNDEEVSSKQCVNRQRWICSKPFRKWGCRVTRMRTEGGGPRSPQGGEEEEEEDGGGVRGGVLRLLLRGEGQPHPGGAGKAGGKPTGTILGETQDEDDEILPRKDYEGYLFSDCFPQSMLRGQRKAERLAKKSQEVSGTQFDGCLYAESQPRSYVAL
uniref:CD209 antigen-like protein A n=1 Tax=Euleptes europaea TaxID=460621 RepID=UPI00254148E1|nr:CD209 antigen-like protein A [Euleptes europaea]